ncbi:MAG: hypothetical protein KDB35_12090 [Acidimicrobiales bacterium]|nr:hypothetical protein [Acidimicrobiales bacterium]
MAIGHPDATAPRRFTSMAGRGALGALVLAMALLPLQGARLSAPLDFSVNAGADRAGGLLLSDLCFVGAAVARAAALIDRRSRRPPGTLVRWGLILLAAGGCLGVVSADDPGQAVTALLRLAAVVAITATAVWGARPGAKRGLVVAAAYVAGATVSALAGIIAIRIAGPSSFETGLGRSVGLAGNSGALGVVSVIGMALAMVLASESRSARARVAFGAASGVLALAVLDSGSRGALLAGAVVTALVLARNWRTGHRRRAIAVTLLGSAIALTALVGLTEFRAVDRLLLRDDATTNSVTQRSTELRVDQYRIQVETRGWQSLAVGSGLQDLEPTPGSVTVDDLRDPHNGHLEVWLGTGLLGLSGWSLVALATIGPGVRLLAGRRRLGPDEGLLAAIGTAYLGFVVLDLTVNNVWNRYVWVLVAWSAWLAGRPSTSGEHTEPPQPDLRPSRPPDPPAGCEPDRSP